MSIMQFCVRKSSSATPAKAKAKANTDGGQLFKPFIVKAGMKLAPVHRSTPLTKQETENFDCAIGTPNDENSEKMQLYLDELRKSLRKPRSSKRTTVLESVVQVSPVAEGECSLPHRLRLRKKLVQFHEDRRPSKYGYWFKTSKKIIGRRPFTKDESIFDYEVDSDDEWEDVEGDDCKSDEEDEDGENDKEADDEDKEFFVDHGYLSTSENASDEEDGDPESKRERGKAKMITFEAQMESRKKKQLRLIAVGPIWSNSGSSDNIFWAQKRMEFNALLLSNYKPVPTSFTPEVHKMTPIRCLYKTPGSERKSVKRKTQSTGTKQSKRGALSLP